jgi:hypothetical protein
VVINKSGGRAAGQSSDRAPSAFPFALFRATLPSFSNTPSSMLFSSIFFQTGVAHMDRLWTWLGALGVSFFCGFILIAIAAGAVLPHVFNPIAAPIVCPHGQYQVSQNTTSYRPGESDTWTTDTCVDSATGQSTDVSGPTIFWSGVIYSLIIFAIMVVWGLYSWITGRQKKAA